MSDTQGDLKANGHEFDSALALEIAGLIVSALNLEIAPSDIDPHAPLYREGLRAVQRYARTKFGKNFFELSGAVKD